jgi:hypothetical protein
VTDATLDIVILFTQAMRMNSGPPLPRSLSLVL